jgi:hypothetical protein
MSVEASWVSAALTFAAIALYEVWFAVVQRSRNSLMSASMTASTAVLGLMGTVSLSASPTRRDAPPAPAGASVTAAYSW